MAKRDRSRVLQADRRMGSPEQEGTVSTFTPTEPMTMPAAPSAARALVRIEGGDQRTVFRGVDWRGTNNFPKRPAELSHPSDL